MPDGQTDRPTDGRIITSSRRVYRCDVLSSEAVKYVQEVPAINFQREINFYAYMKGKKRCMHVRRS